MPPESQPLAGTRASEGIGTHASWAEASIDAPAGTRRSPRLLIAAAGAVLVLGGIVFALTSGGARPAPPEPIATVPSVHASEQGAAAAPPVAMPEAPVPATAAAVPPGPAQNPAPVVLSPPPPSRIAPVPASRGPVTRSVAGGKTPTPPASARTNAGALPAAPPSPAPDAYDVLNQRN
jgi:hypothetical protein